jgi:TM2 domain-containing membrane protein YozV
VKGQVLTFDPLKGEGIISGEDGNRYGFQGSNWRGTGGVPRAGLQVDFSASGDAAEEIFPLAGANPLADAFGPGHKSPIVAGLLALFLGGFGVHKFYLGYNSQGVMLLVGTVLSYLLTMVIIGIIPLMIIGVVCLIEAIIYLTKPEAEFNAIYVEGQKPWF